MIARSRTAQDALEQLVWRAKALPVKAGSRVAPAWMARRIKGASKVHLGCGPHVLKGWANLDMGGPAGVVRFDLIRPLPFPAGSVDFVYSEHFIEHVRLEQAVVVLRECARVIRPGGTLRVSTPDLRKLVHEYLADRTNEWEDMHWSPDSPCDLLNEGMRLWGHQYVWDEARLSSTLASIGFRDVRRVSWRQSDHEALRGLETRPDHADLIVEATR